MAVWFYRSAAAGTGAGTSWANARTTLVTMTSVVAGETIWVADDHAETSATFVTITFPGTAANPNLVICADHTVAAPATGDWKTTGTISNTDPAGTTVITVGGSAYIYGLTFQATGATGNQTSLQLCPAGTAFQKYDSCALKITSNSIPSRIFIGPSTGIGSTNRCEWTNTTVSFARAEQGITIQSGRFIWRKTPSAAVAGVAVTTLFNCNGYSDLRIEKGVDLSAVTGTLFSGSATTGMVRAVLDGCKLGSGVTVTATPITCGGLDVWLNRCDDTTDYFRTEHYTFEGTEITDTTMVRSGGASDGLTPFTRRMATAAGTASRFWRPFDSLPIVSWNSTTGSTVTVTISAIWFGSALPLNDEVWLEASYFGTAGSTLLSTASNAKANNSATGTAQPADSTSAWDSTNVSARANTHAYVSGNRIRLASNPGRVFFCFTAGTSAGSEPGGYASAVDGGSVTDGTAVFKAGFRFTLSVTVTPQHVGVITATVKSGQSTNFVYFDPKFNPQLI